MTAYRRLTCCICALVLAVCWPGIGRTEIPFTAALPPIPLTVEQAVAFALQHNPAVTRAQQDVSIATAQVGVARANQLPDLTANSTFTYNPSPTTVTFGGNNVALGSSFSGGLNLTLAQPVWPVSRWQAPLAGARANVSATELTLLRTRQQIAYQTRQAFYQLLSAQELLLVAQDAVQVAEAQLRLAENTVKAGLAAPLDEYQARAQLASAQVSRTRAENTRDIARSTLVTQLGLSAGMPVEIAAPAALPAAPDDVEALTKQALQQRPDLAQFNFRREQLRASIALIKLEQQPIVNVQGNYGKNLFGGSVLGATGFTASAVVAMSVYNGKQTSAELAAARLQLEQLDTAARQVELGITLDVRQAWSALRNALDQLGSAQAQLDAADEALRIARIRYENGEGIVLEVQQASLNRTQALTALAQARFQAQTAAAQLDFAIGGNPVAAVPAPIAPAATPPAPPS